MKTQQDSAPHHSAILTASEVRTLRHLYWVEGQTQADLARRFNVDPTTAQAVITRQTWKHIPPVRGERKRLKPRRQKADWQHTPIRFDDKAATRAALAEHLTADGDCLLASDTKIRIQMNRSTRHRIRRVAWALCYGATGIPAQLKPNCGNQLCCNPAHLEPGRSGGNGAGKLLADDVRAIRHLWWFCGFSQVQLAAMFEVKQPTISGICSRNWHQHVEPLPGELDAIAARKAGLQLAAHGVCHPEQEEAVKTGTGRLVGPDGVVYEDIRSACLATGVDRLDLAAQLNKNQVKVGAWWHYQPGEPDPEPVAVWGTAICYEDLH